MPGDTTNQSVIWSPGESQGRNIKGELVDIPEESSGSVSVTDGTTTVENVTTIQGVKVSEEESGKAIFHSVVISEEEPDISIAQFWLRIIPDGNSYQLYVRDIDGENWLNASAGLGSGDYGDGYTDGQPRQVGYFNLNYGGVNGLEVLNNIGTFLRSISADGNDSFQLVILPTGIQSSNLPTVAPQAGSNLWWNDGGTIKIA